MHAMHVLEQQYGWEVLRTKRILLIHAGGYSQRTPTSSCLGKIATSIPKGSRARARSDDERLCEWLPFQDGRRTICSI